MFVLRQLAVVIILIVFVCFNFAALSPLLTLIGVGLLFASALLATIADRSIIQPSVTRQILIDGKTFMFV